MVMGKSFCSFLQGQDKSDSAACYSLKTKQETK